MSKKKKLIVALAGLAAALGIAAAGVYGYCANHPEYIFQRAKPVGETDFYLGFISYSWYTPMGVPVTQRIQAQMDEFWIWNDHQLTYLLDNFIAPTQIAGYGEVKDGQTRFWYEGTVTTKDGETLPYFEEKVFDWVLVPDEALSDLKTSPF